MKDTRKALWRFGTVEERWWSADNRRWRDLWLRPTPALSLLDGALWLVPCGACLGFLFWVTLIAVNELEVTFAFLVSLVGILLAASSIVYGRRWLGRLLRPHPQNALAAARRDQEAEVTSLVGEVMRVRTTDACIVNYRGAPDGPVVYCEKQDNHFFFAVQTETGLVGVDGAYLRFVRPEVVAEDAAYSCSIDVGDAVVVEGRLRSASQEEASLLAGVSDDVVAAGGGYRRGGVRVVSGSKDGPVLLRPR